MMGELTGLRAKGVRVCAVVLVAFSICASASAQDGGVPAGVTVWNGDALAPQLDLTYGGSGKALGAMTIAGARNGSFSGVVVVGSGKPIKGLKASIGDLVHDGGGAKIAASAIEVRYPSLDITSDWNSITEAVPHFNALQAAPPATVPLLTKQPGKKTKWAVLNHAYQPVWVTVNVPADAKPGKYAGKLRITVGDAPAAAVPVNLAVHDYRLPDPSAYTTCVDFVQSPESVAMHYGTPLWSEKHFRLMGKSLGLLAKAGNRSINLYLVCETNHGNAESMVRWTRAGDAMKHDFTIVDKYLDEAARAMGKPRMVFLYVWDYQYNERLKAEGFRGCVEPSTGEVKVSFRSDSGAVATGTLCKYGDPASKALWKPVIDGVMARLKKRGLEKSAYLGWATDQPPSAEVISLFAELAPGVPWAVGSHSFWSRQDKAIAKSGSPVKFATLVSAARYYGQRPSKTDFFAWKDSDLVKTAYYRGMRDNHPIAHFRFMADRVTLRDVRGFGRVGGDFWPVVKSRRRATTVSARYPESGWRNLDIRMTVLAPGPDGAIATTRFEMIREGVQECEARLFIEEALHAKTITGDLADRCKAVLADRARVTDELYAAEKRGVTPEQKDDIYEKFVSADWRQLTANLYAAATEVEAKLR